MTCSTSADNSDTPLQRRSPRVRGKPRIIEGAMSAEQKKQKQRDVLNRKRRLQGKPQVGELGKKQRLNRRKNQKRRKRLNIGKDKRRVSGVQLIRRGDGRTMWVRRRKEAGTWLPREEYRELMEDIALSRYDFGLGY